MEVVSYGGWDRCARIVSGDVEVIVTLEVGPRIVRLGFVGQRNELRENPLEMGKKGGTEYRSYGGHRLWVAPEDLVRTYQPENEPVDHSAFDGWDVFSPKTDKFGIHKELRIKATGDGGFHLDHRVTNEGTAPVVLAPWAITVVTPGGTCLVPQAPYKPHPDVLTPVRPIALWSYTDMSDPRFHWGSKVIQMRQDPNLGPTKFGTLVTQGYAAYHHAPNLFVKKFSCEEGKEYPDYGCNFETFTKHDMLEVESLAPLQTLNPGDTAVHLEGWKLFGDVTLSVDEAELERDLQGFVATVSLSTP